MATERELIARVEAAGPRELADSVARPSPEEERVLRTHLGSLPIRMLQEKRAVAWMQSGILRSPLPDSAEPVLSAVEGLHPGYPLGSPTSRMNCCI
jgi:hypothetical protein